MRWVVCVVVAMLSGSAARAEGTIGGVRVGDSVVPSSKDIPAACKSPNGNWLNDCSTRKYQDCLIRVRNSPYLKEPGRWRTAQRGPCVARIVAGRIHDIPNASFDRGGVLIFQPKGSRPNSTDYGEGAWQGDCWVGDRAKICVR